MLCYVDHEHVASLPLHANGRLNSQFIMKGKFLLQETGKDPITQEPLEIDDLVPVKTNKAVKPRPSPATSIPGLLGLFHNVRPFTLFRGWEQSLDPGLELLSTWK